MIFELSLLAKSGPARSCFLPSYKLRGKGRRDQTKQNKALEISHGTARLGLASTHKLVAGMTGGRMRNLKQARPGPLVRLLPGFFLSAGSPRYSVSGMRVEVAFELDEASEKLEIGRAHV